jgi:hypothetical protein
MNHRNVVIVLLFSILLLSPFTSAFFTKSHEYWTIKAFQETNSPITQECKDKLQQVLDGNTGADVFVLHYYDNAFKSYISTHTKGSGYLECLTEAGTDSDLRCMCYGLALHNVQDHFAHTAGGFVPGCLTKSFAPNTYGHMVCENSFETNHMKYVANDDVITSGTLQYYDTNVLNSFFTQEGGDKKYISLLEQTSGLTDIRQELNLFANGYKGHSFYDAVYGQQLAFPWWLYAVMFGSLIFGLGMTILILVYGKTNYKFILVIPFALLLIIGIAITIAFYTDNVWALTKFALKIPQSVGLLTASDADVKRVNDLVLQATKTYLETGELVYEDNSGLTYTDTGGVTHTGALIQAQQRFMYITLPILSILAAIFIVYFGYKTFSSSKKKRK